MEAAINSLKKEQENHTYQISSFNFLYEKVLVHKMGLRSFLNSNYSDSSQHVSKIAVANLQLTTLVDLPANCHAKGCYLLLRTIIKPIWSTAYLTTFVEDHVGSVVSMTLYNYVSMELEGHPRESLPLGSVLILKEPTMRTLRPGFSLQCTSPSDIIIIGKHSVHYDKVINIEWKNEIQVTMNVSKPRTANEWKYFGNSLFLESRFIEALQAYLAALKVIPSSSNEVLYTNLHLNLASTYIRLGYFESALKSAHIVLEKQPNNTKALFRKGRAFYELRQYKEAEKCFTDLLSLDHSNHEANLQAIRCMKRIEETKGNINIQKLYRDSLNYPLTPVDCADYVGPLIIAYLPMKGRKLIANQDIPAGTLLLVSKALAAFWYTSSDAESLARDIDYSVQELKRNKMVTYVTNLVMKNPNVFGKLVNSMYLQDKQLGKKAPKQYCDGNSKQEVIVDPRVIKQIVDKTLYIDQRDIMDEDKFGFYVVPYFMTRSCIGNAYWNTFNDVIIVHAIRHITIGDEIVVTPYTNRLNSDVYTQRLTYFNHFTFQCNCELCELDDKEPPEIHRERLTLYNFYQKVYASLRNEFSDENLDRLRWLISTIEHTYESSKREKHRLALFHPLVSLASVLLQQKRYEEVLSTFDRALGILGLSIQKLQECIENSKSEIVFPKGTFITCRFILVADLICTYYEYRGDERNARLWYKYFKRLDKLFTGCTLYNDSANERKRHK